MVRTGLLASLIAVPAAAKTVKIATFDGAAATTLDFQTVNDPVMGGQSKSTFTVSGDKGIFEGEVKVVTFLGSPGFCNLEAGYRSSVSLPDLSGTDGIELEMKQTADGGLTNWDVSVQTATSKGATGGFGDASWQADFTYKTGTNTYFVPYSAFKCSSRGRPLTTCGTLSEQLNELTQIGMGTDGVAGPFRVELTSISATSAKLSASSETKLATFDGAKETELKWVQTLDPVMGGGSTGSFAITSDGTAKFSGEVKIVSFLKAPGFAKIEGTAGSSLRDISGTDSILLKLRSSTPSYAGFKVAFGAPGVPSGSPFQRQGAYKSEFNLTNTNDWQVVSVPLSHFSYDTSDYTGRCDTKDPTGTQHYCCDKSGFQPSNSEVCVDSKYLSQIDDLQVWAEGVAGDFDLEIQWIGASAATVLV